MPNCVYRKYLGQLANTIFNALKHCSWSWPLRTFTCKCLGISVGTFVCTYSYIYKIRLRWDRLIVVTWEEEVGGSRISSAPDLHLLLGKETSDFTDKDLLAYRENMCFPKGILSKAINKSLSLRAGWRISRDSSTKDAIRQCLNRAKCHVTLSPPTSLQRSGDVL